MSRQYYSNWTSHKKTRECNLETHTAFLDMEKAFDKTDRSKIWKIITRRRYPLLMRLETHTKNNN